MSAISLLEHFGKFQSGKFSDGPQQVIQNCHRYQCRGQCNQVHRRRLPDQLAGGRNTIFLTTGMLLAQAIGTGIVLQHRDWPLWVFRLMALWSRAWTWTRPTRRRSSDRTCGACL